MKHMEKNVVAFLSNHLVEEGMDKEFFKDLLNESCDKELFHLTGQCEWNKMTKTLTTPDDKEREAKADLMKAA